jgi:DNA polymerase phi
MWTSSCGCLVQATEIQSFVQTNPQLGFALILQLTGANGSQQFDNLTKTKTVESILMSMDADGIKHYIDYLLKQIDDPESSHKSGSFCPLSRLHAKGLIRTNIQAIDSRRMWIIEQLAALIRNSSIPKCDQWIQSILDWFVVNGLFVVKKKSDKSVFRGVSHKPLKHCWPAHVDVTAAFLV